MCFSCWRSINSTRPQIFHFTSCSLTSETLLAHLSSSCWVRGKLSGFSAPLLFPLAVVPTAGPFLLHCFSVAYIMANMLLKRILRVGDSNNPDRYCCYIYFSEYSVFACQRPGAKLIAFTALPLPCKCISITCSSCWNRNEMAKRGKRRQILSETP